MAIQAERSMTSAEPKVQAHLERRSGQRFDFQMPVSVRSESTHQTAYGFTQNLSARGAFVYTGLQARPGERVEIGLVMPSEITLSEPMRVLCRGTVLRVSPAVEQKFGVAIRLENYEYLPDAKPVETVNAGGVDLRSPGLENEAMSENVFSRRATWL
jgi:hypothetical protein